MNYRASLSLLGFSSLPPNTVLEEDITVLTSEDIENRRSPVYFAVHRVGNTGISIDLALKNPARIATDLGAYQLCVFSAPPPLTELPANVQPTDLVLRSEAVRSEKATFELMKDEVARSVLTIPWIAGIQAGVRRIRAICLPLAELVKAARLDTRHPMPAVA